LGREKIEALNVINTPFLTTREAFILKDPANQELLTAYRNSDVTGKHKILSLIASLPLPDASIFSSGPLALDIEWFFSVNDLANLIYYVGDLPLFSVNPGVAAKSDWQHIAFKGGSEPGVINLTTLLVSNSEAFYVASVTWNNNEVLDETQFISLYSGLINAIKQQDSN
jgi:hypothetical protein